MKTKPGADTLADPYTYISINSLGHCCNWTLGNVLWVGIISDLRQILRISLLINYDLNCLLKIAFPIYILCEVRHIFIYHMKIFHIYWASCLVLQDEIWKAIRSCLSWRRPKVIDWSFSLGSQENKLHLMLHGLSLKEMFKVFIICLFSVGCAGSALLLLGFL